MNDNFDFNPEPEYREEPEMSDDERKKHKKHFSRLSLCFLAYILVSEGLALAASFAVASLAPSLLEDYNFTIILSSVIQYLIAFPVTLLLVRRIPKAAPEKHNLSVKSFLKYGAVSLLLMQVGNSLSSTIMTYMELALGDVPDNSVNTLLSETNLLLSALIVGIIGPVVEELLFRKLFIDRLTPYGEAVAIFFPALMFGLFHGNLYQFFYAFFIGCAFSLIYVRTGKIGYSVLLHIFVNLFCGVLPSYLISLLDYDELILELTTLGTITEEYLAANMLPLIILGVYELLLSAAVFTGLVVLLRNLKSARPRKGEITIPRGSVMDTLFFNAGTVALIVVCTIIIAINTFTI